MRLLLDAHVSGRRVGAALRVQGHDIRALDEDRQLEGLADDEVLALAAAEERILITHNIAHFPAILREWAEASRPHAGVILVYGIDHSEFDLVARGVRGLLEMRPSQEAWVDFPAILSRSFVSR
jgi:predicted nuclease of predicted toxin-antitoxin system